MGRSLPIPTVLALLLVGAVLARVLLVDGPYTGPELTYNGSGQIIGTRTAYSLETVNVWYRMLRDPVAQLPGFHGSGLDTRLGVIDYRVDDNATIQKIEKLLKEHDVPRDAVVIRISDRPELRGSR